MPSPSFACSPPVAQLLLRARKGCGDGDDYEGEGTGQAQVTRGREFVGRSVNLWLSLRCFSRQHICRRPQLLSLLAAGYT